MPAVKQLREKRAQIWSQMTSILDTAEAEERSLTAEERQEYDTAEAELDGLTDEVRQREAHEVRAREMDAEPEQRPGVPDAERATGEVDVQKRYDEVFWRYVRGLDMESEDRQLLRTGFVKEDRAQGVGTTTAGGYLVPRAFRDRLIEQMKWFGSVRSVAEVITTESGATLEWPTMDDTGNVGAILAENTQVTEQDVTVGQATLGAYKYTSKLVRVSIELLQDDAFDLENRLRRALATRLGRITNTHYTTGTGSSQPLGIQTNATVGKTGAAAQLTTVIYEDLIDLIHSIDPAYRGAGGQFMLNDLSIATVRKIKDANGLPLWQPNVQVGAPDTILGYGLVPNNDMPVMAANARSILFGDFVEGYVIRDVLGIQQMRLAERYADYLQVGFLAFLRTDATVQNASAYKAFRHAAA